MDKPRIAQVLGVEVGERVYYKDPNDEMLQFFVQPDGVPVFAFESGEPVGKIGMGYAIAQAINHPGRIIRKPRWTEQEVEDATHLKKILESQKIGCLTRRRDDELLFCDNYGKSESVFSSISLCPDMFPSLLTGKTVTLDEIIGGAQ